MTSHLEQHSTNTQTLPVFVAGAGLAGLTAALFLARAGHKVILLEQSAQAGGRGKSRQQENWTFNLGPHALYRAGQGISLLQQLGIQLKGKTPAAVGTHAFSKGQLRPVLSAIAKLSLAEKLGLISWILKLMRLNPADYAWMSTEQWLKPVKGQALKTLIGLLIRVSTYCADFSQLSAEVAIQQLQLALKGNVLYLDGGWQSLVDQLLQQAQKSGVEVRLNNPLKQLKQSADSWLITPQHGPDFEVSGLILALPPQAVQKLLAEWPELLLHQEIQQLQPVRAACLDLGLKTLPAPKQLSAFGLDEASYLSVHSASARLAPDQGALIHAAWYLGGPDQPHNPHPLLEARLDALQPGWRQQVSHQFYYPHLHVVQGMATAQKGGLAGRPAIQVKELNGVYLAGDWVGQTGWLADAALASGHAAAQALDLQLGMMPVQKPKAVKI